MLWDCICFQPEKLVIFSIAKAKNCFRTLLFLCLICAAGKSHTQDTASAPLYAALLTRKLNKLVH